MADVFDLTQPTWNYTASASPYLYATGLAPLLPGNAPALVPHTTHKAAWWADHTKGYDWSKEDRIPAEQYNHLLWEGLKGAQPYPAIRGGDND
jgi:hypothetical protein